MSFVKKYAYEASAGSGKTFALVVRYITLLFMGAKPETILTLTFTNKASNEMSVRIGALLKELHLPSREVELTLISQALNKNSDEILSMRESILKSYLKANLKISTIDKFFAQILRKFSLYAGLMPDFGVDESSDEKEFLKIFLSLVKVEGRYKELIEFSIYEDKRLNDIFGFLESMYDKDSELGSIGINKGDAFALESKILSLCDDLKKTFEREGELSESLTKTLIVHSIDDLKEKKWLCKDSINYWQYKKYYTPQCDEILVEIKEHLRRYYRYKEGHFKESYMSLFDLYKKAKYRSNLSLNLLKFNDISYYVHKLLRGDIDNEFLYFRLDSKIDHLLIDEFQDTNILQFKILEPIIDEITSGIGREEFRSFFYVGDIKQSIYRFRGGAKELFNYVAKRYEVKVDKLLTNYRSKANIVEFVNETFRQKIKGYTPQLTNDGNSGGYVQVIEGEEVLKLVIDRVDAMLQTGVSEDDIAILTYANSDAYIIKDELIKLHPNLNVTTQANLKLIHNKEVGTVIELLKYLYFKDELFLSNFLASIGEDIDSSIDLSEFNIETKLPKLIKQIVTRFKLYDRDENILKLINISHSYSDIEEFLFESENIGVDSPSKKSSGLKILTIHKSKGLEFKHLVVTDRFKKKNSKPPSLIFHYDDVHLQDLYVTFKQRECVDEKYSQVKETLKELEHEDELNLLYVAFTRAKESLQICKKECKSAFDILDLKPLEIGEFDVAKSKSKVRDSESFEYKKIYVGPQEDRSKKEKEQKDDIKAINFGLALHYMLEILDGFESFDLKRAYWAMKNRYEFLLLDGECERIKKRVERLLDHKEFLELVDGDISKEQPISYKGELKQLDLLIEKDDEFIIIDYKSSKTIQSSHIKQVSHYKEAIKSISNKDTKAYLCYVREDEVELVEV